MLKKTPSFKQLRNKWTEKHYLRTTHTGPLGHSHVALICHFRSDVCILIKSCPWMRFEFSHLLCIHVVVAASQVDLSQSVSITGPGTADIGKCPITYYGQKYKSIHVSKVKPCWEKTCFSLYCLLFSSYRLFDCWWLRAEIFNAKFSNT